MQEAATMSDPLISVLMPVYNAERYVTEAVESILAQTFCEFEFLIIDDGSTDRSRILLEDLAARDSRIRFFSRANTGYTQALNEGLALSRGTFIARMDADDVSVPTRFEIQLAYLRAHPDCVAVGTGVLLIDPDGQPLCGWAKSQSHEEIDRAHLGGQGGAMVHPATIFRRDTLLAIGGYRVEFEPAEDLDVFLRLAERGRLANVPDVLVHYRQHMRSVGHQRQAQQLDGIRAAVTEAHIRRGLPIEGASTILLGPPVEEHDHHRKWAWWALGAGHVRTARKHALHSLRLRPFSVDSWRVAACALRGY
jgi:glycosyltransferase involved in cell wall biosynthesis